MIVPWVLSLAPALWSSASPSTTCAHGPPYPKCTVQPPHQGDFTVSVVERNPIPSGAALISHANKTSTFNFAFATAWFPPPKGPDGTAPAAEDGLVVRVVECNDNHHVCTNMTHPEWTNAGALTVVKANLGGLQGTPTITQPSVGDSDVFWAGVDAPPRATTARWGAADPRIAYRALTSTYYLAWDNCTRNCFPTRTTLLSTTKDPFDKKSWIMHGALIPGEYTAGAALLFPGDAPPASDAAATASSGAAPAPAPARALAFVGNSNTAAAIWLAEANDDAALTWSIVNKTWMVGRPGCWDECGVAPGGQVEQLSSGDYLLIYNIDTGYPYVPNPLGRCAIGWAILDRKDPKTIIARAELPLITATQPWETCNATGKGYACQEPHVTFTTGMKPLGGDEFLILYGAADTDVGATRIKVDVSRRRSNTLLQAL